MWQGVDSATRRGWRRREKKSNDRVKKKSNDRVKKKSNDRVKKEEWWKRNGWSGGRVGTMPRRGGRSETIWHGRCIIIWHGNC